ncbi:Ig-like domain-containing protein [Gallaecimonas kandeliae]|uniref:Ig-like domain-containing protein n=1 Tax=Gallaecimonas kandeliae TaxID=3029055 RepID=UPI002647D477|nr:Ig-like domain-containing protein [Gallaecimonas kandeliae]WKE65934.1 Ig-like domain-containing protein [Gallaecimonas kandeliae]
MSRAWLWLGLLVAFAGSAKELVLVDAELAPQLKAEPGAEVRAIRSLGQLPGALAGGQWDRVSLVSHGRPGALLLGGQRLDQAFLAQHPGFLDAWRNQLTAGAQLELWGCDLAKGQGHNLVDSLSAALGRPVLASIDATGPASLGGNLRLEYGQGRVPDSAPLALLHQLLLSSSDSQDFESFAASSSSPNYPGNSHDFGAFTISSNAASTPGLWVLASSNTNSGTKELYVTGYNGDVTTVTVKSTDGSEFKLNSLYIDVGLGGLAQKLTITAYRNGASQGSTNVDYSSTQFGTSSFSGISAFDNIDEIRITSNDGQPVDISIDNINVSAPVLPYNSDGNLTAGGGSEPGSIATNAGATAALDFTLSDGGTSDGVAMTVSQVQVHVSGTSTATERGNAVWTLTGPDISGSVTGSYSGGVVTFSGLSISVADGGSETYTVNADLGHSGMTEGHTFILSLDGDTDLTIGGSGTQMGTTTAVTNGSGFATSVTATKLAFTTQPAGSVSGSALITQPVVTAQDAFGNTDTGFTSNVSLSEASAGALSGTTTVAASSGVVTFSNLVYTASADQEAFTLTAAATGLTDGTASPVTSDVVATKLIFTTQPAPTSISSGSATSFSTVPVVKAVDANNTLDTGYSTDLVLSVTNTSGGLPAGTVNSLSGTGDTDGNGITVTLTPSSGSATFSGLQLQYTNSASTDSIALHAASGGLSTANSTTIISAAVPVVTDGNISISGATGTGGAYIIGDTVTATWNNTAGGDNNSGITGVTVDFSQFGGGSSVTASNSAGTWTATYTINAGSIDATNRNVSVSATNANGTKTTADTTNATVDSIAPTVTDANVSISGASGTGGAYVIGDTVTATWNNTGSGDNNSDTIAGVTVNFSAFGGGSSVAASNSAGTWTATYTITAGAIDAINRNVSVTATDNAGNTQTTVDSSNATVDNVAPTVTDAHISISGASGTGGAYKIGDTVTATWDNTGTGDNNSDTIAGVTVNFSAFGGGSSVAASNSGGTWTATYTLTAGSVDATNRNISVSATDNAGNTKTTTDTTNATVDSQAPTVTDANITISGASGTGGAFKVGDTVTATWNNTGAGDNNSDTITGVTVDFSQFGGGSSVAASNSSGTWTATYTLVAGSIEGSNLNISVTATDDAGNVTATSDTSNATVDNQAPTVTDANMAISGASGTGGAYVIGDTVTATWNNTVGGDNNGDIAGVTVNFSAFGGGSSVAASNSAGTWTATYTITAGAIDAINRNVSVTATDNAGNTQTTVDSSNATVDNVAPTVTDAHISISGASGTGGAYKIGDTVTATWDNTGTGDNNSDTIAGVTVNFSAFGGGSSVAASNSGGTWTATYTLTAGSVDATNRNISVSATDNAGNTQTTSDTSNATVDSQAPTVTDANITISGASGTGGAFKVGDTVTATWNNTGAGDNNGDIAGVTVNFSAFGGGSAVTASNSAGTWTATYTLVAGSIEGSNLNISVTATDDAGNASTTSDSSNATVDTVAPAAPSTPVLDAGSDGGTLGDGITNDNTPTLTGTGEASAQVLIFDGASQVGSASVDGSGNWSLATSTLADGSHSLTAKQQDGAGNLSSASGALALTIDATAPAGYGLVVDQSPVNAANQGATSVTLSGAEVGTSYSLTVSSSGGGSPVVATGSISAANQQLTGIDVSGLPDGTLSYSLVLTDTAGNAGTAASANVTKDTTAPSGYGASFDASYVNIANQASQSVTLSGEVGASYQLTISDGSGTVSRSGTLASASQSISSLDLSGLADGSLSLSLVLTDSAGNAGTAATANITKDTVAPTLQSTSPSSGATKVALNTGISLQFSEAIQAGTSGSNHLTLTASDSTAVFDSAADGSAVALAGDTASLTLSQDLVPTLVHQLAVGSDAFTDLAGNPYAGGNVLSFTAQSAAPSANADSYSLTEDQPAQLSVLDNDTLVRGSFNKASLTIVTQPQHGSLSLNTGTGVLTYNPAADYNGADSFSYQVQDSYGDLSSLGTVTLTLAAVNDAPRAQDDTASLQAGATLDLDVLANDVDVDSGDSLNVNSLALVTSPAHGTATVQAGKIHYQAASDYVGTVTLSYQVADTSNGALSNEASVTLSVQNADAPVANADSGTLDEDSSLSLDVLANDSGAGLDASTLQVVVPPAHGQVTLAAGKLNYVPVADYNGADSFSYLVQDGTGQGSNAAAVSLTINPVNDAPVANADTAVLTGSQPIDINVKGNDGDVDNANSTLTVEILTQPAQGSAAVNGDLVRYTPSGSLSGDVSFTYRLKDPSGAVSAAATVTITNMVPNEAPLAVDDSAQTDENQPLAIDVLANDSDHDGSLDVNSLAVTSQPAHGSVVLESGKLKYSPATDFHGSDSFAYQVADNQGALSNEAQVSVRVLQTDQAPVISGSPASSVQQDASYSFVPSASDADNDPLSFSIQNKPAWASFDTSTGTLSGQPGNADVGLFENIVISVSDGILSSSLPAFSIEVVNVNDAPVAVDDSYGLDEGGLLVESAAQGVLANDSDPDQDPLAVQLLVGPLHAQSFSLNADGSFSYQHDGSETQADSFSYSVSDGQGGSATAVVSLAITPVDDAPVFTSTPPSSLVAGSSLNYKVQTVDPDSAVSLTLVQAPDWLTLNDDMLSGTAPLDASGSVTVELLASDGLKQATQRFDLQLAAPQQSLVALTANWQGLPAKVGKPLSLVLSAQHQGGPALSGATLELSLQGATMETIPGCSQQNGVQQCSVNLAAGAQQQFSLPVSTQNQGDQTVAARLLDSQGQVLAELTTDVTVTPDSLSQGDRAAVIAKATALTLLHDGGQPLLVVGTSSGEGVTLYNFTTTSLSALATLDNLGDTRALAALDWNQDGLEDLVVVNDEGDASGLYLNQGNLHFSALQSLPYGRKVRVADLNHDGYKDLLIGGQGLYFYPGSSGGSAATLQVVQAPFVTSEFELWPDGRILVTDGQQLRLIDLKTVADQSIASVGAKVGIMATAASTDSSLASIRTLHVADLDGDGHSEAVASYGLDQDGKGGGVTIMAPDAGGDFQEMAHVGEAGVGDILVADYDGDGDLDLLVQHDNGSWQLLANQGGASNFKAQPQSLFHPDSLGLVADLNGDGMADILLANADDGTVAIYDGKATLALGPQADLGLSASLASTETPYQSRYQLKVHNQGPDLADAVTLTLMLPAGSEVQGLPAGCVQQSAFWQCPLGSLESGADSSLTLTLTGTAAMEKAALYARVDGSAADNNPDNNSVNNQFGEAWVHYHVEHHGGALGWPWLLLVLLGWRRRR